MTTERAALARRVKRYNRLYHETESALYDGIHPEILEYERQTWRGLTERIRGALVSRAPRCLDAGSGSGFIPRIVSESVPGSRWACVDISPAMLRRSRELVAGRARADHVVADCENLPFGASVFDLVTVNSVLHHLPDAGRFLAECHRVLRPDGVLVIAHEPNRRHYRNTVLFLSGRILARARRLGRGRRRGPEAGDGVARGKQRFRSLLEERLRREGLEASYEEVSRLVDLHSPTAGGRIDRDRGFRPEELLRGDRWSRIETRTYAHLGKLSLAPGGRGVPLVERLLERLLTRVFPEDGSLFWLVARK